MLQLLSLHDLQFLHILGLQAQRVKIKITRYVARAKFEVILRNSRLHPATQRSESLRHGNEQQNDRPKPYWNLPKLVDANAIDLAPKQWGEAALPDQESQRCQHGNAAVSEFCLT